MEIYSVSKQGARPTQEDRVFSYKNKSICVFGVFDGHGTGGGGGAVISQALVDAFKEMCKELTSEIFQNPVSFRQFIRLNFENIDKWLLETYSEVAIESGSTASLGFYDKQSNTYYAVNLGDSRTIFFEVDQKTKEVRPKSMKQTLDHKPSDVKEIARIEKAGGVVRTSNDSSEVPRVDGVLALSRAFADFQLKTPYNDSDKNWVSVMPNVIGPLHPKAPFYSISCSDGVFDQTKNKEIVEIVLRDDGTMKGKCEEIVDLSLDRWKKNGGKDNVTCVIFELKK